MNGTSNQLSSSTFASISTDLNNGFTSKKNKSPLKSVNKKKLTADASVKTFLNNNSNSLNRTMQESSNNNRDKHKLTTTKTNNKML